MHWEIHPPRPSRDVFPNTPLLLTVYGYNTSLLSAVTYVFFWNLTSAQVELESNATCHSCVISRFEYLPPPPPLPQMGIEDIDFFHSTPELEWEGRPTAFDKSQFLPVLLWGKAKSESHSCWNKIDKLEISHQHPQSPDC